MTLSRILAALGLLLCTALLCAAPPARPDPAAEVGNVLDRWHAAAARADEAAYFAAFAPDAVFIGTDATEYWTVEQFREYAHPYFARGKAWSFTPRNRHVYFSSDGKTAWFDEALDTQNMGECRGSGVLASTKAGWRIVHYNLSIPIPNELVKDFVARIADHAATGRDAGATSGGLRVVTFNIRYANDGDGDNRWSERRTHVGQFLASQHADVVSLQEALRSQLNDLDAALPGMTEIGVGRDDGKKMGEYAAIFFRTDRWRAVEQGTFWFSDTPEVAGSKSWGNAVVRICTWARLAPVNADPARPDAGAFYVFNVHLDHQSQNSRERSARLLLERIAARTHDDPVIVTGDFNAGEDNPAVRLMKGEPGAATDAAATPLPRFFDSYRILHPDEKTVGTFNDFKGKSDGPKIDYIFVLPGTRVINAEILRFRPGGRDLSDHYPVSASLEIPAAR